MEDKEKDEEKSKDQKDSQQGEENEEASSSEEKDPEAQKKGLERLLKTLKNLEQEKKKTENRKKQPGRIIMIEFGSSFHKQPLINFIMYFLMNLLVFTVLFLILDFVSFERNLPHLILFVFVYTFLEMLFRNYVLFNHFKFVMRTLGFIFFFGYLTIFFILVRYVFSDLVAFPEETLLIVYIGMFIVVRYVLSHLIRHTILKAMR